MLEVFKKLRQLIFRRQNTLALLGTFTFMFLSILFNILAPYAFSETVTSISSGLPLNILGLELTPILMAGTYAGVWTLGRLNTSLKTIAVNSIAVRTTTGMLSQFMGRLMSRSLDFHLTKPMSEHITHLKFCLNSSSDLALSTLGQIVPTVIEVGVAVSILSVFYGLPLGAGLAGIIVTYTGYSIITANKISATQRQKIEQTKEADKQVISLISNYETIHNFNNLEYELNKLEHNLRDFEEAQIKSLNLPTQLSIGQILFTGIGFATLSVVVALDVVKHYFGRFADVSDFVLISYYLVQFAMPLTNFGEAVSKMRAALIDLKEVVDFINTPSEVESLANDYRPSSALKVVVPASLDIAKDLASIEFKGVTCKYNDQTLLDKISFRIAAGKRTAIVGKTSAGKSTIVRCLMRLYSITGGSIVINGQDIADFDLNTLRSKISIVPQNPVMFNDTLRNNLIYGTLSSDQIPSDLKIHNACKTAQLTTLINRLSDGYDTVIGERGQKISGGGLQRLAIARAILREPLIYIFDEATSGLDPETESEILNDFNAVSKDTTTIMITHKREIAERADWIIVLENGQVIAEGTSEDLRNNKKFNDIWNSNVTFNKEKEESLPMLYSSEEINFLVNLQIKHLRARLQAEVSHSSSLSKSFQQQESSLLINEMPEGEGFALGQRFLLVGEDNNGTYADLEEDHRYYVLITPAVDLQSSSALDVYFDKQKQKSSIDAEDRKDVFDELSLYFKGDRELHVKILFPFNITSVHWLTGEVQIHRLQKHKFTIDIYAHNPYGRGRMSDENFAVLSTVLRSKILDIDKKAKISINNCKSLYAPRQTHTDIRSCGVIVVDEVIKRITGVNLSKEAPYPMGANTLRLEHVNLIKTFVDDEHPVATKLLTQYAMAEDLSSEKSGLVIRKSKTQKLATASGQFGKFKSSKSNPVSSATNIEDMDEQEDSLLITKHK